LEDQVKARKKPLLHIFCHLDLSESQLNMIARDTRSVSNNDVITSDNIPDNNMSRNTYPGQWAGPNAGSGTHVHNVVNGGIISSC
jgi:hypothetical protein